MPLGKIKKKVQAVLNALDCPDGELSIVITDDAKIEILNQEYLHHQGPTNVISFPMQEGEFSGITPSLLGDVVISADTADREAHDAGLTLEERMDQLLIHGILHLFGFDHEADEDQAAEMEKKANELFEMVTPAKSPATSR